MENMGDKASPWILCASKKFPGKVYYFNTKTGEKGWTLSDGTNCMNGTQKKNKLKNMDPGEDTPMSNNSHGNTTQSRCNLPNTSTPSTHLDPDRVDLPDLSTFKTQAWLDMAQNKQHTLKQPKLNNDTNKSSNSQKLPIIPRFPHSQANLLTETPMNETNFSGNTQMSNDLVLNETSVICKTQISNELVLNETSVICNTQMSNGSLLNKPILWRQPKRLYSDSEDSSLPNLNMEKRRKVSFSQQKVNDWHSKYEVPLKTSLSLRHAKPLKHLNNRSWKFSPAINGSVTSQEKYKPVQNNPFSSKIKYVKQKNTYYKLGRIIENSTDDTQSHTLIFNWDLDDAHMNMANNNSQLPINNQLRSNSVKVDINLLRRLSKSKNLTEWWLVPDVDVLLENFDFLREFVMQDLTCSIMSPAAVLRVVYLMRDDRGAGDGRTAVAEQVFDWLATHSVCEVNEDVYPLEETVIHGQIIKSCVIAKIQHLVLVTKNKKLMHAAKLNGIYAYYLSELEIQQKTVENNTNNTKNNLFLQNIDSFDPFPLSKKDCTVENNNNAKINNLNFTIPKPSPLKETKPYEHIEIRLNNNGERIVVPKENLNNRKKFDDEFLRSIQVTVNRNEKSTMDIDQESDDIFPITNPNANKQIYFDQRESKKEFEFNNRNFFNACENSKSKPKTQRKANNMFEVNNPITGVSCNESNGNDKILPITNDSETIEKKINEFCTKHADLQAIVNERLEEWTCWYLQVMEDFMDEFFQQDVKKFEPPYWFLQGVRCLQEHYCRDKAICALADKLIGISGFCIKNGVIQTNIKADQFLKILGAGMILIEMVENTSQFPECGTYKDMLKNIVAGMQDPEDFPDCTSVSLPFRSSLDDEAFSIITQT